MTDRNHVIFRPNGDIVPVKAVQYDGTDEVTAEAVRLTHGWELYRQVEWYDHENCTKRLNMGQWLAVSESGEVWVPDREPVWVEYWTWRAGDRGLWGEGRTDRSNAEDAYFEMLDEHNLEGCEPTRIDRRPHYSNGMTGPWVEVGE